MRVPGTYEAQAGGFRGPVGVKEVSGLDGIDAAPSERRWPPGTLRRPRRPVPPAGRTPPGAGRPGIGRLSGPTGLGARSAR